MLQRMKPSKLMWTTAWRRLNKKMNVDVVVRKRTRKATKVQRAIVGVSLEEIKKKRAQKPAERSAQRVAALNEVKERNKSKKLAKAKAENQANKSKSYTHTKGQGKNARGGQKR